LELILIATTPLLQVLRDLLVGVSIEIPDLFRDLPEGEGGEGVISGNDVVPQTCSADAVGL
jgi:hypothetical protein